MSQRLRVRIPVPSIRWIIYHCKIELMFEKTENKLKEAEGGTLKLFYEPNHAALLTKPLHKL